MWNPLTKYGTRSVEVRRARKEFYAKLGIILGVALLFGFLVLLARLGPTSGPSVRERQTVLSTEERAALTESIARLEVKYLAVLASGPITDESALAPLLEAIELQTLLNTGDSIVPLRDAERIEGMLRIRDRELGNLLFSQSQSAEDAGERAAADGRFAEAIRFLTGARELQERINTNYPRAESRSTARVRALDNRVVELQAVPVFEQSAAAENRAREAMQNGQFEEAVTNFREAFQLQEVLQRDFRASRFASVARLRSLERDLIDARAAIANRAIEETLQNARAALSIGNSTRAGELFGQAIEQQRRLMQEFPGSRLASPVRLQEMEVNQQNAQASLLATEIQTRAQILPGLLARRQVREAQTLIGELNRMLVQLQEQFPLSRQLNEEVQLRLRYLAGVAEDLDAIQSHVFNNLRAIPGLPEAGQMLTSEVSQLLFSRVMLGENPSSVRGEQLPVESVSWQEAVLFCQRLSWILGLEVRLPTRGEFVAAIGNLQQYNVDELAWHSQNTQREIQPIARRKPNSIGFFDLLGNVAEWLQPEADGNPQQAPVIGGSVRDNPRALAQIPVENRLRNERNRITGFRIIVR